MRFQVIRISEARERGLPGIYPGQDEWRYALYDFSTSPPILIETDDMEPEDAIFLRDLSWVPKLLNELTEKNARLVEVLKLIAATDCDEGCDGCDCCSASRARSTAQIALEEAGE